MRSVAILGSGFMGRTHAAAWRAQHDARVDVVFGRNVERAGQIAGPIGARATDVLDEALEGVDVADICLPTFQHRSGAEAAFDAGCDVLLEKPIALTLDDADAIIEAAERSGRTLMVAHALRFWPEYAALADLMRSGALGAIVSIRTERLSPPPATSSWFERLDLSGGMWLDLLVHDYDFLNWTCGLPARVAATGVSTTVMATAVYDGAVAWIEGSWDMPAGRPFSSSIRVVGTAGSAEYAFTSAPGDGEGSLNLETVHSPLVVCDAQGRHEVRCDWTLDPYQGEIRHFLDVLAGDEPPRITPLEARDALAFGLGVGRALAAGTVEPIPD